MSRDIINKTYRIRQVPFEFDASGLANALARALGLDSASSVQVCSLAVSCLPWEISLAKVATVVFSQAPEILKNDHTEWEVQTSIGNIKYDLIIDEHFKGFTPLNEVDAKYNVLT
jgi:hypothetical protein